MTSSRPARPEWRRCCRSCWTTTPATRRRGVRRTSPAVIGGAEHVSYGERVARAGAMAGALAAAGVRAGDVVGVCVEPGAQAVARLLGVWQSGAAYVPLDPAHPAPRLAGLIADARPAIVVSEAACADR